MAVRASSAGAVASATTVGIGVAGALAIGGAGSGRLRSPVSRSIDSIALMVSASTAAIDTGTRKRRPQERDVGVDVTPAACHAAARIRASMAAEGSSAAVARA